MVEFLNHKNEELRNSWSKTFREVLKSNNMNTVMLEAIREVIKAIRKRDYKVEPDMVSILISLPLRNMEKPTRKKIVVKGKVNLMLHVSTGLFDLYFPWSSIFCLTFIGY